MGRRRLYDWEDWFARPRTELLRGRDFQCTTRSMVQLIRNMASARNLRVRVLWNKKDSSDPKVVLWVSADALVEV